MVDFHLNSWLNTDGSDLLDNFERLCDQWVFMWILIWNRSQVLEPSPQGVFLVVILSLGRHRTGHLALRFFSFVPLIRSAHLLQRLHFAAGEGDPNPVNGHLWLHGSLAGVFKDHGCGAASWPDLFLCEQTVAVSQKQKPTTRLPQKSCPELFN